MEAKHEWKTCSLPGHVGFHWQELNLEQCQIVLEPRPHYCNRGNFIVKVFVNDEYFYNLWIDEADMFPRYYFDEGRAKAEIEAWIQKRKVF
jgi:hypothetical protein